MSAEEASKPNESAEEFFRTMLEVNRPNMEPEVPVAGIPMLDSPPAERVKRSLDIRNKITIVNLSDEVECQLCHNIVLPECVGCLEKYMEEEMCSQGKEKSRFYISAVRLVNPCCPFERTKGDCPKCGITNVSCITCLDVMIRGYFRERPCCRDVVKKYPQQVSSAHWG